MTTRTAAAITPDCTASRSRRLRISAVVLAVALVHATVLTSLELPREPSGRGQAVVSSAVIVRQVAIIAAEPAVQSVVQLADAAAARGDAVPMVLVDALALEVPSASAPPLGAAADASATPASRAVPRGTAGERRPAAAPIVAVSPARARSAAAAPSGRTAPAVPDTQRPPPTVATEAAVHTADAFEGEPGASAADALLPEHLLRSLPTYAVRLPPSQRLHFRVSRGDARGEGTLDWSLHDDGRYSAALRLRGEGLPGVDWTSEGDAAGDAGVLPRRMVAHRKGRAVAAANFAVDEQKVSFSGARVERPFMRGGQDRLTWMLQLAGVLEARAQPMRDDERIVLYVVGPRGAADLWQWRVAGRETLGDGAAAVPAVKLVREAQRLYDTEIELWLDPAHHHLPLKWRQQQRGVERPALEWERVPG
jgi:Protein of unknown function (DUF3108)